jgi:hypothetical protein
MDWQAHFEWWVSQPEVITADEQRRAEQQRREAEAHHQQWELQKAEARIQRHTERLQRAGVSNWEIQRLKRLAGVSPEEIERELSGPT